ncbi:glycosyltransferase family 2 protein [Phormidesmis sp. 146-33]
MSHPTPKVSVVMSVYNGSQYLREAVDSILNQTFTDFEFIIINDCSTDSTWPILIEYADRDSRIVLLHNERNLGLTKSLNKGLSLSKGKYIARQDGDDISFLDRLSQQFDYLEMHPEVGTIGTAVELINPQGSKIGEDYPPSEHERLEAAFLFNNPMHHSTLMSQSALMQSIGGYNETFLRSQDYDMFWRLSRQSRLENISRILLKRRMDDRSRITTIHRKEQLEYAYKISLNAVQELTGTQCYLPETSYQRLWWALLQTLDNDAYQKYWLMAEGVDGELTHRDIKALNSFWDFIRSRPLAPVVWGQLLEGLLVNLFAQRKLIEGLQLIHLIRFRWKTDLNSSLAFKSFLKPYAPKFLLKVWRKVAQF